VIAGPGDETAAVASRNRGHFRASHADREAVIGTLKAAFVQGRLTEDELDARTGRVYASRTYAELAEVTAAVTADIPVEPAAARPPRNPWRATKIAWRIEYALLLPGIVGILLTPGGPGTTLADGIALTAVVYVIFWAIGAYLLLNARRRR
jgi:Domain of unknown function (DUF1707)